MNLKPPKDTPLFHSLPSPFPLHEVTWPLGPVTSVSCSHCGDAQHAQLLSWTKSKVPERDSMTWLMQADSQTDGLHKVLARQI